MPSSPAALPELLPDLLLLLRPATQAPANTRAHLPGVLESLLLALLASLFGRLDPAARSCWNPSPATSFHPVPASAPIRLPNESRAANRLRAWIGWILRFMPDRGMAPSGRAPALPSPIRTARAPPRAPRPRNLESVAKTPPPAVPTHAQGAAT